MHEMPGKFEREQWILEYNWELWNWQAMNATVYVDLHVIEPTFRQTHNESAPVATRAKSLSLIESENYVVNAECTRAACLPML